ARPRRLEFLLRQARAGREQAMIGPGIIEGHGAVGSDNGGGHGFTGPHAVLRSKVNLHDLDGTDDQGHTAAGAGHRRLFERSEPCDFVISLLSWRRPACWRGRPARRRTTGILWNAAAIGIARRPTPSSVATMGAIW